MRRLITAVCLLIISLSTSAQELPTDPNATLLAEFGRGEVKSVGWSPDGESVWVGTSAGTWELDADLNERRAFSDIKYGALSPDGKWLAGYSETGFYVLHDLENDRRIRDDSYGNQINPVIDHPPLWSADSQWIAYRSLSSVFVLNIANSDRNNTSRLMWGTYQPLAWSESGRFIAGYDGKAVWMLDTQADVKQAVQLPSTRELRNNYTNKLAWFGDEALHWSSLGDGGDYRDWRWDGEQFILSSERRTCLFSLCSPDGRLVFRHHNPRSFSLLSIETQEIVFERDAQFPQGFLFGWEMRPIWSPDSRYVVVSTYLNDESLPQYGLAQLDAATGEIGWFTGIFRQKADFAIWDSAGTRVLTTANGVLAVLDGQTGEILARNADFAHVQRIALNDGGTRLALADGEGRVTVGVMTEQPPLIMQHQFLGYPYNLHWQPSGNSLLVIDSVISDHYPQAVHRFNTEASQPHELLFKPFFETEPPWFSSLPHLLGVYAAWKPDGSQIAVADLERVYLAQSGNLEEIYEAKPDPDSFYSNRSIFIEGLFWNEWHELPTVVLCCQNQNSYWFYTGTNPSITPVPQPTRDPSLVPPLPFWTDISVYINSSLVYPMSYRIYVSSEYGYAILLDDYENGMVWRADGTPLQFLHDVKHAVWTEDDLRLAIIRLDGSLWVLSLADNQLSHVWTPALSVRPFDNVYENRVPSLTDETTALVWSADGATVAYNYGGVVRVWRLGE